MFLQTARALHCLRLRFMYFSSRTLLHFQQRTMFSTSCLVLVFPAPDHHSVHYERKADPKENEVCLDYTVCAHSRIVSLLTGARPFTSTPALN